jgi:hypothetical protein
MGVQISNIRYAIAHVDAPSWVAPLPNDFGSARHGKLTADQWRSAATVYMPIALMYIWSTAHLSSDSDRDRLYLIISNTLDLMEAIHCATSWTVSSSLQTRYINAYRKYLRGIRTLFPKFALTTTQHCALHLHEFFPRFGPVIGWWTFPYERIIQLLQRMNHSHRTGESTEVCLSLAY